MFYNQPFYHGTTKKIINAFGTLFNDIHIVRTNSDKSREQIIKVPVSYANKMKYFQKAAAENISEPNAQIQMILPRISFEITNIYYDAQRKLNTLGKIIKDTDTTRKKTYNPVPYNIGFAVYIGTIYQEDALQIVEQILPYFRPSFVISHVCMPELDVTSDIIVTLESTDFTDSYDGPMSDEERLVVWTLNFVVTTYLFGPIEEQYTIKKAIVKAIIEGSSGPTNDKQIYTHEVVPMTAGPDDPHTIVKTIEETYQDN